MKFGEKLKNKALVTASQKGFRFAAKRHRVSESSLRAWAKKEHELKTCALGFDEMAVPAGYDPREAHIQALEKTLREKRAELSELQDRYSKALMIIGTQVVSSKNININGIKLLREESNEQVQSIARD